MGNRCAGHIDNILVAHPNVAEAAAIGKQHGIKGKAIGAFVPLKGGVAGSTSLVDELKAHLAEKIGALVRPDEILVAAELSKTRSGEIMLRFSRDIACGCILGDTTILANLAVVARLKEQYQEE